MGEAQRRLLGYRSALLEPPMAVPSVSTLLTARLVEAVRVAGLDGYDIAVERLAPTSKAGFGDYQSNHAMRLAKAVGQPPRVVAERIKQALEADEAIARVEVAGPGFLNLHLKDEWLCQRLALQCEDPAGGVEDSGQGRTVVIDYSSPNVAKRMHIGHMRSTIIGNALHRLYQASGWTVLADNHIGDWGTQFGMLIVAWRRWLDPVAFEADPVGELERLYVAFREAASGDAGLEDLARQETARLQAGDPDNQTLWKRFVAISMAEFQGVYDRLGVQFDMTLGESFYNPELPGVVESLLGSGLAEESEGAVVVRFAEDAAEKSVRGRTLVIRKQDGAFLYGTTDLATIEHRLASWAPARAVYVTDGRQQLHFQQVFAAWKAWRQARGLDPQAIELVHTWFGTLKLPEGMMSTRKGNVIRLVELLDEAVRRARAVVDEKSPSLDEAERASIAEAVGLAAVRYSDLSQNPQSDVIFDWDRMLAMDGNTAPFLLYSYARCRALQRKGEVQQPGVQALAVSHPLEAALVRQLLRLPDVVAAATEGHRPNLLCDYLFDTAQAFNRFYYEQKVLQAESEALRASRLALVEASARVMGRGMELLGLRPLGRM